jgi:hypothetical protein
MSNVSVQFPTSSSAPRQARTLEELTEIWRHHQAEIDRAAALALQTQKQHKNTNKQATNSNSNSNSNSSSTNKQIKISPRHSVAPVLTEAAMKIVEQSSGIESTTNQSHTPDDQSNSDDDVFQIRTHHVNVSEIPTQHLTDTVVVPVSPPSPAPKTKLNNLVLVESENVAITEFCSVVPNVDTYSSSPEYLIPCQLPSETMSPASELELSALQDIRSLSSKLCDSALHSRERLDLPAPLKNISWFQSLNILIARTCLKLFRQRYALLFDLFVVTLISIFIGIVYGRAWSDTSYAGICALAGLAAGKNKIKTTTATMMMKHILIYKFIMY